MELLPTGFFELLVELDGVFLISALFALGMQSDFSKDVKSPESTVASLYDVISGPAGRKRNWDRMRYLFAPNAKLVVVVKRQSGESVGMELSVEDYVQRAGPNLEQNGFFEREIARRTETFGNICQVWSTYESRKLSTDKTPFERGINGIQLWSNGERWFIQSVIWQGETADLKLPKKYVGG